MRLKSVRNRSEIVKEFYDAHNDDLFNTLTIAAVLTCSPATLERDRWAGDGIPYLKLRGRVRYRKSTVLAYINQEGEFKSTRRLSD
jgi:hypothetical protein